MLTQSEKIYQKWNDIYKWFFHHFLGVIILFPFLTLSFLSSFLYYSFVLSFSVQIFYILLFVYKFSDNFYVIHLYYYYVIIFVIVFFFLSSLFSILLSFFIEFFLKTWHTLIAENPPPPRVDQSWLAHSWSEVSTCFVYLHTGRTRP
jgi:hypothetical protein